MVRGPGALGDLREGLGAAARRHGGVTLSRAWVDRLWAALGGQWGQRGRCHLSRSVGLGAESWIDLRPHCACKDSYREPAWFLWLCACR